MLGVVDGHRILVYMVLIGKTNGLNIRMCMCIRHTDR